MELKNGRTIHRFVKDSWGEKGYVFWVEDSYWPTFCFVRGESFSDAYDWFLCDPSVERDYKIDPVTEFADYGYESVEAFQKAFEDGEISGITYNDNGVLINDELVNGTSLADFCKER